MWWRRRAANSPVAAPVVPPPPETAHALLHRLEWQVLKRLDGTVQGERRPAMRGAGLDLADLREYTPNGVVRHIDWNVTARMSTPYVREFMEDRAMVGWLVLDLSPSVGFGSGAHGKFEVLLAFAGVLSRLLTRHGNRVGALLFGGDGPPVRVPPGAGRAHVLRFLATVQACAPRPDGTPTDTRLTEWLGQVGALLRQRCSVFVVSDFISPTGWERPLGQLAHRHDVLAVRLVDPLERAIPDMGWVPLRDLESGERLWVDTQDTGFRQRFAALAQAQEDALLAGLAAAGVDTLGLSTDEDLVDALRRLLTLRQRRGHTTGWQPPLGARA